MSGRSRRALPGALILLSLAVPATAAAVPVTVNLRVEGATQTIFEGPVITDVHPVKTPSDTQARPCDGSSTPAMTRSSVVFPAPFGPRTPIFAPGRNASVMSSRTLRSGP